MGRTRNKRRSTTKDNGNSKKSKAVNVSSDDESTEENNTISESERSGSDTDTSNKRTNVAKNGGGDDDDDEGSCEAEPSDDQIKSDTDSDDMPLINVAKKADEVAAILACERRFGQKKYRVKWKDTARGQSWISGQKTLRLCPEAFHKFVAEEKKANEIEAILSHKNYGGDMRYLVKWKDHTKGETWQSERTIRKFGGREFRKLFRQLKKEEPKDEVEAIVSHKKPHGKKKYLVKWKDLSKGETWVGENRLLRICPQLVSDYEEEVKRAFLEETEVEAILEHKKAHGHSKYLIKWKDHSKGKTWETATRTAAVGQVFLDQFVEQNPDCAPEPKRIEYKPKTQRKKRRKRKSREMEDEWEDSDTDMESRYLKVKDIVEMSDDDDESYESYAEDGSSNSDVEWEVEQIVGVKKVKGESRQYLIRWKGYGEKHDSWESEEQLNCPDLIKKFNGEVNTNETQSGRQTVKQKTSTSRHTKRSDKKRN
ncbi:uncharacterized protein LOC119081437 [Bradysia coprophila]|uniref:uncharacterized protein LOC119081437 n=1 Tax=Bradysia coprophila TaxID=38358 RepID=UPI00187D961E|nr:uncharacterized protein LOC119081437 [Bradysia coprophila]